MRRLQLCALLGGMIAWVGSAQGAVPQKKKAPAKAAQSGPAHSTPTTARKSAPPSHTAAGKSATGVKTASSRGARTPVVAKTTWRNRQLAPAPERYREIQDALVSKGYLKAEDANGAWNPASTDALKRFQGEQNLDSSGKINALSLIALGLGPKRDTAAVTMPPAAQPEFPGR
jgi:hypothetical protein